jgi:hypothetical protein
LDRFARLPDDLVIATTEVGLPGVLAPRKTVVDLAGLNEREFATRPFSAERLFARYRPDLVYMPHRNYAEMARAIEKRLESEGYDLYTARQLGMDDFGLAIRRDSRHYEAMREIVGMEPGAEGTAASPAVARPDGVAAAGDRPPLADTESP